MLPEMFSFVAADGFRLLHVIVALATFAWALALVPTVIARGRRLSFVLPALLTLAATVGIFLSGSLFTLFVCFEVMSIVSYLLVIHPADDKARRAGGIYLAVAVLGGMAMLMGLLLIYTTTGSLDIATLPTADNTVLAVAGLLLLVGFGAKAGMFPLHVWLPMSYTDAPYCGTIILSSALSKAGTFGIVLLGCTLFAGNAQWGMLMLLLGLATMLFGGILAVASRSIKTTLAYSSMSQVGFILSGVGMVGLLGEHSTLAARGIVLHTINHSLVKLVLFTVAGVICTQCATAELARLRGAGRGKPLLHVAFLVAGAAIAGVPGLGGYISKTLLHEGMVEYIHLLHGSEAMLLRGCEGVFLLSGGLTVAYIGKLYYTLFVARADINTASVVAKPSPAWSVAALVAALPLAVTGIAPHATLDRIADATQGFINTHLPTHAVPYFAWVNLRGAVISLSVGAVVLAITCLWLPRMRRAAPPQRRYRLDLLEQLYIPVLYHILPVTLAVAARIVDLLCLAPMRWLLGRPKNSGKVYPKLNFSFGSYTEQSIHKGYFAKYLPSSLKYSLITFSAGLLLAMGYLVFLA